MKITCNRCTMSFRVEPTKRVEAHSRCPECKRLFWHCHAGGTHRIRVGIDPKWLPEWEDDPQTA